MSRSDNPANARPWQSTTVRCGKLTANGLPCANFEIDTMGACFQHVPDDMLEEAEGITGLRRCRVHPGCREIAVANTVPPSCQKSAQPGTWPRNQAEQRGAENRPASRLTAIMEASGERILKTVPVEDPLTELLDLAGEIRAMKELLREIVAAMKPGQWRYSSKVGEQVRAELLLYERALERYASVLIQIAKLKIDDRLARVSETQVRLIEQALAFALESAGLDLEGQDKARQALRGQLQVLDGGRATAKRENRESA